MLLQYKQKRSEEKNSIKEILVLNSRDAEYIAEKLKDRRKMRKFNFHSVKEIDIADMREETILIWGNGDQHHVSYWFDHPMIKVSKNRRSNAQNPILTKINIDQHSDAYSLCDAERLYAGNHFLFSSLKPKVIGMIYTTDVFRSFELKYTDLYSIEFIDSNNLTSSILTDHIQITVDLDVINCFPVLEEYLVLTGGWNDEEYLQAIESLKHMNIVRFDIGGIDSSLALNKDLLKNMRDHYKRRAYSMKRYKEAIRIIEETILALFG